ncbi:hypothetical protein DXT97_11500 [Agrobacterium tumefaciens]|nr:hypothetical protein [Agrobacterium tumefaciens]
MCVLEFADGFAITGEWRRIMTGRLTNCQRNGNYRWEWSSYRAMMEGGVLSAEIAAEELS